MIVEIQMFGCGFCVSSGSSRSMMFARKVKCSSQKPWSTWPWLSTPEPNCADEQATQDPGRLATMDRLMEAPAMCIRCWRASTHTTLSTCSSIATRWCDHAQPEHRCQLQLATVPEEHETSMRVDATINDEKLQVLDLVANDSSKKHGRVIA